MAVPKRKTDAGQHATKRPVPIPKTNPQSQETRVWSPTAHDAHGWYKTPKTKQVED